MTGVRVAEVGDLARIAMTATRAFADDPLLRWFFPSAQAYEAAAPAAFRSIAEQSVSIGCTYVSPDVVAVGMYFPPDDRHQQESPADDPAAPAEAASADRSAEVSPELAARFETFGRAKAEHTPPEPHWYLNVLATHPDWQRQGLGSAIVAPIAERVRSEGVPLFLETQTAANVAYYRHLGFTVRSEWDLPPDGPHMWGMLLAP